MWSFKDRGPIGVKTGKSAVLPRFCKIERCVGSGGAPPFTGVLSKLGMRCASSAPERYVEEQKCHCALKPEGNQTYI